MNPAGANGSSYGRKLEAVGGGREPASPERVGPYRLVREVGRGGMGSVYVAEREGADFEQRVAVKLLRRGLDTDDLVRRFVGERRILAGLDHPNIARLLDGGSTDDARPYLLMEYVEGTRITEYCDDRALGFDSAEAVYRELLRWQLAKYGPDDLNVALTRSNLGFLLRTREDFVGAVREYRESVRTAHGVALLLAGRRDEAEAILTPAYEALQRLAGSLDDEPRFELGRLAGWLEANGHTELAECYRRLARS